MLKKILRGLLVVVVLLLLLGIGWLGEAAWGWRSGSMWLWPLTPIVVWLLVGAGRRAWLRWQARQRLRTTREQAPQQQPDARWSADVQAFLRQMPTQGGRVFGRHPVHFVIGAPGAGKTTLLDRSAQSSSSAAPIGGGMLRFLDAGVAVEVPGLYIDPARPEAEREAELQRLLASLKADIGAAQCRSIVLCVAVHELAAAPGAASQSLLWSNLHRLMAALMAVAERRLPVYVVLTHIDELPGVADWLRHTPEIFRRQPAGVVLPVVEQLPSSGAGFDDCFERVLEGLPLLMLRSAEHDARPLPEAALQGLDALAALRPAVARWLSHVFSATAYRELPILRGLFLAADGPTPAFGAGLFASVLAHEHQSLPLGAHEQRKLQRRATLALAGAGGVLLLAGWLAAGYWNQLELLDKARAAMARMPADAASRADPAVMLLAADDIAAWLRERDASALSLWLPLDAALDPMAEQLRQRYVDWYAALQDQLLGRLVQVVRVRPQEFDRLMPATMEYLISTSQTMTTAMKGASVARLESMPRPAAGFIHGLMPQLGAEQAQDLEERFALFASWAGPKRLQRLSDDALERLRPLARRDHQMAWLIPWAARQPGVVDIRRADFWAPGAPADAGVLSGPFTAAGAQVIASLLKRIDDDPLLHDLFASSIASFRKRYAHLREAAWNRFVVEFDEGRRDLDSSAAWVDTLSKFNSPRSPYRQLEQRVLSEFAADAGGPRPEWVLTLEALQGIRAAGEDSFIGRIGGKLDIVKATAPQLVGSRELTPMSINQQRALLEAGPKYKSYADAFGKAVGDALVGQGKAAALAAEFSAVGADPKAPPSELANARTALLGVQRLYAERVRPVTEPARRLMFGELNTATAYAYREANCSVQTAWEQVRWGLQMAATDHEAFDKLTGESGTLWQFTNGDAKPFLRLSEGVFVPAVTQGWALGWKPEFMHFVNDIGARRRAHDAQTQREALQDKLTNSQAAARQKEIDARLQQIDEARAKFQQTPYTVSLAARPIAANADARAQPYGYALTLNCAPAAQGLTQLNFSQSQSFVWAPASCGDTELKVFIADETVVKRWPGELGFIAFLRHFRDGRSLLGPKDFNGSTAALEQLGVKQIEVMFDITGGAELLKAAQQQKDDAAERDRLQAEKAALEKTQTQREATRLNMQIESLRGQGPQLHVPDKVTSCAE